MIAVTMRDVFSSMKRIGGLTFQVVEFREMTLLPL
jgi:hypothetical protein